MMEHRPGKYIDGVDSAVWIASWSLHSADDLLAMLHAVQRGGHDEL